MGRCQTPFRTTEIGVSISSLTPGLHVLYPSLTTLPYLNEFATMLPIPLLLLCWVVPAMSQFFNFGNMFNQQQQQEPQNMASDSEWYQTQYEAGMQLMQCVYNYDS